MDSICNITSTVLGDTNRNVYRQSIIEVDANCEPRPSVMPPMSPIGHVARATHAHAHPSAIGLHSSNGTLPHSGCAVVAPSQACGI